MNILLTVAYDGTGYFGWQRQKGQMTVQQKLEEAISAILGTNTVVAGASRTDTGVHALGQRVAFCTDTKIPTDKLPLAINTKLPPDIKVTNAEIVPDTFHPRFQAKSKKYRYMINNSKFMNPLLRNYAEFESSPLDIDKMKEAAKMIVGERDFAAFCASGSKVKSTVRFVYSIDINCDCELITLMVTGNGFLYNMVRIIAGTLIYVGCGKIEPQHIEKIISSKDRTFAGKTARPGGLTLMSVEYDSFN